MKTFYKVSSFVLTLITIFSCFSFSAFAAAIKLDGEISTREWSNAKTTAIFSNASQSANNISFAEIKAIKADANTLYLAFSATNPVSEDYLDDCGIRLTISDMGTYNFGADYTDDFENNDNLDVEYHTTGDLERHFFFEFKVTFKKPIPDNLQLKVQFKDGSEILSREVTLSDFIGTAVNPLENDTTTTKNSKTPTSKRPATTKFSANKGETTKFSADIDSGKVDTTNSTTEETTNGTSEVLVTNSQKSNTSKITRIGLTALTVLLVLAACSLLIFARPKAKEEENKKDNESKNTKK